MNRENLVRELVKNYLKVKDKAISNTEFRDYYFNYYNFLDLLEYIIEQDLALSYFIKDKLDEIKSHIEKPI